eukprot:6182531-Pleurochrysis_carterae.AAC.3
MIKQRGAISHVAEGCTGLSGRCESPACCSRSLLRAAAMHWRGPALRYAASTRTLIREHMCTFACIEQNQIPTYLTLCGVCVGQE